MPNLKQAPMLINKKPKMSGGNFIQIDNELFSVICKTLGRKYKAALLLVWFVGQGDGFRIAMKTACDALSVSKDGYYEARKVLTDMGLVKVTEDTIEICYDMLLKSRENPDSSNLKGLENPDSSIGHRENPYSTLGLENPDSSTGNRENPDSIFSEESGNSRLIKSKGREIPDSSSLKSREIPDSIFSNNLKGLENPDSTCLENPEYNIEEHRNICRDSYDEFLVMSFTHKEDPSMVATGQELLNVCEGSPENLAQVYECYPETQRYSEYFGSVDWSDYEW